MFRLLANRCSRCMSSPASRRLCCTAIDEKTANTGRGCRQRECVPGRGGVPLRLERFTLARPGPLPMWSKVAKLASPAPRKTAPPRTQLTAEEVFHQLSNLLNDPSATTSPDAARDEAERLLSALLRQLKAEEAEGHASSSVGPSLEVILRDNPLGQLVELAKGDELSNVREPLLRWYGRTATELDEAWLTHAAVNKPLYVRFHPPPYTYPLTYSLTAWPSFVITSRPRKRWLLRRKSWSSRRCRASQSGSELCVQLCSPPLNLLLTVVFRRNPNCSPSSFATNPRLRAVPTSLPE